MAEYIHCSKCNYFPVEKWRNFPKCGHNDAGPMILLAIILAEGMLIGSIWLIVNGWKKMDVNKVQGISRIILGTIIGWILFAFTLSDEGSFHFKEYPFLSWAIIILNIIGALMGTVVLVYGIIAFFKSKKTKNEE